MEALYQIRSATQNSIPRSSLIPNNYKGELFMRVLGVIPARYASKRLPGKALAIIAGRPMIQRVYEQAQKSARLNEVLVATDDERIFQCVEGFGGRVVMTSPDHPCGTNRIAEAVVNEETDFVVNIQGDLPFVDPQMIDEVIEPMLADPSTPMATLMHPIEDEALLSNPSVVKVIVDVRGYALYFSRSLIPYPRNRERFQPYEHIGLYVYRRDFLMTFTQLPSTPLEQIEALEHGYRIKVVLTRCSDSELSGLGVDTPADVEHVERLLCQR